MNSRSFFLAHAQDIVGIITILLLVPRPLAVGTGHNLRRVFFLYYFSREAFAVFACCSSLTADAKPRRNEATGIFQECLS